VRSREDHHTYECFPGAAGASLPPGYRPRQPTNNVLYEVVQEHLEEFLERARERSESGYGLPRFVEDEFRKYMDCGIFSRGFARVRCDTCQNEFLVAFSCKGRAFCPACNARRMCDTASHLVDRVLPAIPYRQFVLSFPRRIRFLLARDASLLSDALRLFLRVVFAWQRRQARKRGIKNPQCGAVCMVQRFGGAAGNLNCHFHLIAPDGVFTAGEGVAAFHALAAPTDEEVAHLLEQLARRMIKLLERRFPDDEPVEATDALAEAQAASVQALLPGLADAAVEEQAEQAARSKPGVVHRGRRCAFLEGFSLHANVHVHQNDREGLERLARYAARPPIALDRLEKTTDGRVSYRLKRTWDGGQTHVVLTPLEFMSRLASIVPPPRRHLVLYAGVFSAHSKLRALVVPEAPPDDDKHLRRRADPKPAPPAPQPGEAPPIIPPPGPQPPADRPALTEPDPDAAQPLRTSWWTADPVLGDVWPPPSPSPREPATVLERRLPWAALLKHVYAVDVLECARCGGRMRVIAFLSDPPVVRKILDHLHIPSSPPRTKPARSPPQDLPFGGWGDEAFIDPDPASEFDATT